jgi:DNA topoisomerase-1
MSGDKRRELPHGLSNINPRDFEVSRRRRGAGWSFHYLSNKRPVKDRKSKAHLESIPVPNTWSKVRLSLNPRSHIQAAGFDGSGKLQYLYHERYLEHRNSLKFEDLPAFGSCLPQIRRSIARDLRGDTWTEQRLMALLVRILDRYHLRVGTRLYATRNDTFGLTTLRKKHLKENQSELSFEFIAKGGKERSVPLNDPSLVKLVREVAEFPGWELFSIQCEGQKIQADAHRINEYIRRISGENFTARTFRTWAGTVLCVKHVAPARREVEKKPNIKLAARLTERVAEQLGNTPAICRQYYIHPDIFEACLEEDFDPSPSDRSLPGRSLYRVHECRTMELLSS